MTQKLTAEVIAAAIDGFEAQKIRIDQQIADLRGMLNGNRAEAAIEVPEAATHTRKKFSAASRRKMALAQKARWAKIKGESEPAPATTAPAAPKRKRRMSKEGRARIVAATKARWARVRAEQAQLAIAATKKGSAKKSGTAKRKSAAKKVATAQAIPQAAG